MTITPIFDALRFVHCRMALLSVLCVAPFGNLRAAENGPTYYFKTSLSKDGGSTGRFLFKSFESPLTIPKDSFLEYEIFVPGTSPTASHAFGFIPPDMSLRAVLGPTFENSPDPNADMQRDIWVKRKLEVSKKWGDAQIRSLLLSAPEGFLPKQDSSYEIRLRNVRLTNRKGETLVIFQPSASEVGDPASVFLRSSLRDYDIGISDTVSAKITPTRWFMSPANDHSVDILLRNRDPFVAQSGTYQVKLREETSGKTREIVSPKSFALAPGKSIIEKVTLPDPLSGNIRVEVITRSTAKEERFVSEPITVSDAPEKNGQFTASSSSVFYGGVVSMSASPASFAALRASGANAAVLRVMWYPFETAPGVYDFERLEQMLSEADRAGLSVCLETFYFSDSVPPWLRGEAMLTQDGKMSDPTFWTPSYWSRTAMDAYKELIHAIVSRYKDDRRIVCWNFQIGHGDAAYGDRSDPSLRINDYSPAAANAFRRYVKDELRLSLEQASGEFKQSLATWNDLALPRPDNPLMLSQAWRRWMQFRDWTIAQKCQEVISAVRAVDASRPIGFFGDGYAGTFSKAGEIVLNGGLDNTMNALALGSIPERNGQWVISETSGTPANVPAHQLAMYQLLRSALKGYCWIHFLQSVVRPEYDNFADIRSNLEHLQGTKRSPASVALLDSMSVRWAWRDKRRVPWGRGQQQYPGFFGWLEASGFNVDFYYDTDFAGLDPAKMPFLALAPTADVLLPETEDSLVKYVSNGGRLLLWPTSGKYSMGMPEKRFALLEKLGLCGKAAEADGKRQISVATFSGGKLLFAPPFAPPTSAATTQVIANFKDGAPAVASWSVGKGSVWMIAGFPQLDARDQSTFQSFYLLWRLMGFPAADATSGNGKVDITMRRKGDDWFAIVRNREDREIKASLHLDCLEKGGYEAKNLTSSAVQVVQDTLDVTLSSHEVVVFQLVRRIPDSH